MVINIQDDILRLRAMGLLEPLLQDKVTKGNILWATDAYAQLGEWYSPGNELRPQRITGDNSDLIKTRARRAMEQRTERTRQHAEVFTPLWVVKKMCDFADEQWFGRRDGIYKYTEDGKIYFSKQKHWKLYVDARRLEITCGEAPFLATRYDVETGEAIPVEDRIGLLDRKLRAVSENAQDIDEWKAWALRAVQATYGYELQGDNLLIARVNIFCSVEEHLFHRWRQKAEKAWLEKLCNVIAWNLWQMDGIKGCVPVPPKPTEEQLSLFPPLQEQTNLFGEMEAEDDIPCRLFDWRGDRSIGYQTLREKGTKAMKFDFIIGNPPYQENQETNNKAEAIYHFFYDGCETVANKYMLISPARFLFNAGLTPKAWNKKMLSDRHVKVISYFANSSEVFSNTNINGGVAIIYRDAQADFGEIEHFVPNNILRKLSQMFPKDEAHNLSSVVYQQYSNLIGNLVPMIVKEQDWQPMIDEAWNNRAPEDYSEFYSQAKADFTRTWDHSRTKVGRMLSIEELAEKAEEADSIFDIPDPRSQFETRVMDSLAISEFTSTLSERDMKILDLKNRGYSVTEIAPLVGYQSHSAVVKRLKKITDLYDDFVSKKYQNYLETF